MGRGQVSGRFRSATDGSQKLNHDYSSGHSSTITLETSKKLQVGPILLRERLKMG